VPIPSDPRPAAVPEGFRFGVATAGYQIEGGYNGPGEPRNNWYGWEAAGRVEPSGAAVGFWDRYEEYLDLAAGIGCNSFRLSVEWARAEPEDGHVDAAALDRYHTILEACHRRGLVPLVTLHHFTHPWWLGEDFWLDPKSPERFADWARVAVEALGDVCADWITTNECNIFSVETYLTGTMPPGRIGALRAAATALDHLVAAHVLAYEEIHRLRPDATVATNNFSLSVYEMDRMPLDILTARSRGIERRELPSWLAEQRAAHYRRLGAIGSAARGPVERFLRGLAARSLPAETSFGRTVDAVYAAESELLLDVAQIDYYAPRAGEHFVMPGSVTSGGRTWLPSRPLWDDAPDAAGLTTYLEAAGELGPVVWVVENGMCNRVRRGRSYPRIDGWTRDRYLRANLAGVMAALDRGVPVGGYWHWTLVDNYEWGSYEPRFGLYGVDRERGLRVGPTDSMGVDAAGAYRSIIAGLRSGERSVLAG